MDLQEAFDIAKDIWDRRARGEVVKNECPFCIYTDERTNDGCEICPIYLYENRRDCTEASPYMKWAGNRVEKFRIHAAKEFAEYIRKVEDAWKKGELSNAR